VSARADEGDDVADDCKHEDLKLICPTCEERVSIAELLQDKIDELERRLAALESATGNPGPTFGKPAWGDPSRRSRI
jgi:hypothetical protein